MELLGDLQDLGDCEEALVDSNYCFKELSETQTKRKSNTIRCARQDICINLYSI